MLFAKFPKTVMTQWTCYKYVVLWSILAFSYLPVSVASNAEGVGGYCIAYAQGVCRDLSDPMYIAIFKRNSNAVICRNFDEYHTCIQQTTSNCPLTEKEKDFYDKSFVQFFKTEYQCHTSVAERLQSASKASSNQISVMTLLVIFLRSLIICFNMS